MTDEQILRIYNKHVSLLIPSVDDVVAFARDIEIETLKIAMKECDDQMEWLEKNGYPDQSIGAYKCADDIGYLIEARIKERT